MPYFFFNSATNATYFFSASAWVTFSSISFCHALRFSFSYFQPILLALMTRRGSVDPAPRHGTVLISPSQEKAGALPRMRTFLELGGS
jgi:hypothetical protein